LGWVATILTTTAIVFGLHYVKTKTYWSQAGFTTFEAAFYNGFSKLAWGLAMMWIVISCAKGYGGVINSFLSWGFFKPLARMSYLGYLTHLGLISSFFYSQTYTVEFTDIIAVRRISALSYLHMFQAYFYVGFIMITFGICFVGTLTIEMPFVGLEKLLLGRKMTHLTTIAHI